jgi:hypothetical protein
MDKNYINEYFEAKREKQMFIGMLVFTLIFSAPLLLA